MPGGHGRRILYPKEEEVNNLSFAIYGKTGRTGSQRMLRELAILQGKKQPAISLSNDIILCWRF
jgi:hypothetical protein